MNNLTNTTTAEATPPPSAASEDLIKKYRMAQDHGGIIPLVGRPDSHCEQILTTFLADPACVTVAVSLSDAPRSGPAKALPQFEALLQWRLSCQFKEATRSEPRAVADYLYRHRVSAIGISGLDRWGPNVCNYLIRLAEALRTEGPPWDLRPVIIFTAGADWDASAAKWLLPRTPFMGNVVPDVLDFNRLLLEMRREH